ncbi:Sphingomyelin synthase related [Carabus blaptoides fortunei]
MQERRDPSNPSLDQFNQPGGSGDTVPVLNNNNDSLDSSGYDADDDISADSLETNLTVDTSSQARTVVIYSQDHQSNTSTSTSSTSSSDEILFHVRHVKRNVAVTIQNDTRDRMVLDPKFSNRNDYGSIHSSEQTIPPLTIQRNSTHALLNPRTNLSTTAVPVDDDEVPATSKMTQGDLYQRQPLLPTPTKNEKWGNHPATKEYFDDDEDDGDDVIRNGSLHTNSNGVIKISMPAPVREEPKFPKEKWKTLIALFVMVINFILTTASLAMVHERVPDRGKYGPLPDKFLDTVPAVDWALDVSEYLIMISVNATAVVLVFHKHRFIVFRRVFLILSLLYLMRAITMYITVLPVASRTYYCSPKANQTTAYLVTTRVLQLISGFGLSVNGKHTYCGDYIYSGHTVILVLSYLLISEYSPKRFFPFHWISWIVSFTGIVMVLLAHGHYSVDIVIAYYVTTRLFWTYHSLANNSLLKKSGPNNYIGREWWFPFFQYFEKNVGGPVPRQYDWPLPWPRRCHSKSRDS